MEILFLSAHLPTPRARQAGQKTSYGLCDWFAKRHAVHLLTFATEGELAVLHPEDNRAFHCWDVVPVTDWSRLSGVASVPGRPLSVASRFSRRFRRRLRRIFKTHRFDVAILDHTAMWQYTDDLEGTLLRVGSAHDSLGQAWERRASQAQGDWCAGLLRFESRRIRRWEQRALSHLDLLLAHNGKDSDLLGQLDPRVQRFVIHPWVSVHEPREPDAADAFREPGSVVFWGAMDRRENVDAVQYAVRHVLPPLRRLFPSVKLYVAGNHSERLGRITAATDNVILTGFIDDVPKFLSRMQVALLPLRLGAGIKVKTLECMAAGLPVVTTPVGAEGVGGESGIHYWVADDAEQLAERTALMLHAPQQARLVGQQAQNFFFSHFDFLRPLEALEALLLSRIRERLPPPAVRPVSASKDGPDVPSLAGTRGEAGK